MATWRSWPTGLVVGVALGGLFLAFLLGFVFRGLIISSPAKASRQNQVNVARQPGASITTTTQVPVAAPAVQEPASLPTTATVIRMLSWNIESGGNDPSVIAEQLRDLAGYDIYALQEVSRSNAPAYASVFGDQFSFVMSTTGGADHLLIGFDTQKFKQLEARELTEHGEVRFAGGRHRLPLFVRLRHRESGRQIVVMTNHLARADAEIRQTQSEGLREWAREKSEPIFAIGDFNFDYSFRKENGNEAFRVFMRDGVWKWIRPETFVDTQWSGDHKDRYPDSMLDFTFVAGAAKDFACENRVIVRDGDFPDDRTTSDHRPVELIVRMPR